MMKNGKILLRIINTIKHKAIANFILSLNYKFSLRGYSMRELGSASNIAHITNWTDNESGLTEIYFSYETQKNKLLIDKILY